jgi:hypothetical protein
MLFAETSAIFSTHIPHGTMTTKPPSQVQPAAEASLEQVAYSSVAGIPTTEPHDQDRLGYGVWYWLTFRKDPLETVVRNAHARLQIPEEEAIRRIRERLQSLGVQL